MLQIKCELFFQDVITLRFYKNVKTDVSPPGYIVFRRVLALKFHIFYVDNYNMLGEVIRFLKICVSKIFFKNV